MTKIDFSQLTGEIITKNNPLYKNSILSWNRAIEKFPSAIIYCLNKSDIVNAIKFVRKNNLKFRIRSGCHHYEGFSTGDDLIVIDVSKINAISIDKKNNIATIEAGTRNREVYEAICSEGYAFPGGGCPTVGAVGFTLGGGWGYSARYLGLGSDNLLEAELIDYNGNILIANEKENSDLFWALKGAGAGNFGVVTKLTFKLTHQIRNATLIHIDYFNISLEEKVKVFLTWQKYFKTIDNRFNCKLSTYNSLDKGSGSHITGIFYGTSEEAKEVLKPFLNVLENVESEFIYQSVLQINRDIQDAHPDYESYKSTGRFITRDYTEEEVKNLLSILEERPKGSIYAALSLYGMGGNIKTTPKDSASFYYRDADAILGLQSVWEGREFAEINKAWVVDKFTNYTKPITAGSFIAFPIKELDNYEKEYYGENVSKLKEIKKKYDPINLFNFEQSL